MTRFSIIVEMIRQPADAEESARLSTYLTQKYGSNGWSVASMASAPNTLVFAMQKPFTSADAGGESALGHSTLEAGVELMGASAPKPARPKRKRKSNG